MGDDASISPAMVERDPVAFARPAEFRDRVLKENVVVFFTDPDDPARKLDVSLRQALRLDLP